MSEDQLAAIEKEMAAVTKEMNPILAKKRKAKATVAACNEQLRPLRVDYGLLNDQRNSLLDELDDGTTQKIER